MHHDGQQQGQRVDDPTALAAFHFLACVEAPRSPFLVVLTLCESITATRVETSRPARARTRGRDVSWIRTQGRPAGKVDSRCAQCPRAADHAAGYTTRSPTHQVQDRVQHLAHLHTAMPSAMLRCRDQRCNPTPRPFRELTLYFRRKPLLLTPILNSRPRFQRACEKGFPTSRF
jgi:hypothetical protein